MYEIDVTILIPSQSEAAHAVASAYTRNESVTPDGPPTRVGRFELHCELGKGAKSVVYQAQEMSSGKEVALKIIKLRGSFMDRQRVRREVEVRLTICRTILT